MWPRQKVFLPTGSERRAWLSQDASCQAARAAFQAAGCRGIYSASAIRIPGVGTADEETDRARTRGAWRSPLRCAVLRCTRPGRSGSVRQESVDHGRYLGRSRDQKEMAVVDHVEFRVRDEGGKNFGIDQRDQGIVLAVHDESGLAQPAQPRQAAPAPSVNELIEIAASGRRPDGTPLLFQ